MKKALFITFDIIKDNNPTKSLAIGSIFSFLKNDCFLFDNLYLKHISINMFYLSVFSNHVNLITNVIPNISAFHYIAMSGMNLSQTLSFYH